MNNSHVGKLVLSEKQIQDGVKIVAEKLNNKFTDAVVITVVPGGILFTASGFSDNSALLRGTLAAIGGVNRQRNRYFTSPHR